MNDNDPLAQSDEVPPEPIAQLIYDRLNASLQREDSDPTPEHGDQLLAQVGLHLRQWRIKCGFTRQKLADKLHLDVNQLLVIENGMAVHGDITAPQLHRLASFLTEDELDHRLHHSIQRYLTFLKM